MKGWNCSWLLKSKTEESPGGGAHLITSLVWWSWTAHGDQGHLFRDCTVEMFLRCARLNPKCPCCAPYFTNYSVIMRLLGSAVSPGDQDQFLSTASAVSCSPRVKPSPSPSLGTLQPSMFSVWEGFIALIKLAEPKGTHCLGPCTNHQTLRMFPKLPSSKSEGCSSPVQICHKMLLPWVCRIWELFSQTPVCGTPSCELLSPEVSYPPQWQSPIESHLSQHLFTVQLLPLV